jgi:hypothetical protein
MDIDKQCLPVFKSFISDIMKVYPEHESTIRDTYGTLLTLESCKIEEQELLKEFLERVHKLNKKITNKDEALFTEDSLILTNVSFKELWTTNISYKTKETIWKYLQTFCLLSLNYQSNKDLQEALDTLHDNKTIEITDKKVASDVKKIKKMTENIQEPIADDIQDPGNQEGKEEDNPFADMEKLINGSEIGKIAKEVSESLDIEGMLGGGGDLNDPMALMQTLMSGDAMSKIMGTIHNVVNDKVESGELNKESMVTEAEGMYGTMGTNPLFQAMSQMGQAQAQPTSTQSHSRQSNQTRARLQRKLKEKQQNVQVNKVE